jgi:uncharacterized protein (DUF2461 family)
MKETISSKIDGLTDSDIRNLAVKLNRPYLDLVRDLQSMKRQSEYYRSDKAKEAAKRYREQRKVRVQALKSIL